MYPLMQMPGGWELIVIVLVVIMLFGAKKLPELARGTGQALRIFKSETKGLRDDDESTKPAAKPAELPPATGTTEAAPESKPSTHDGN